MEENQNIIIKYVSYGRVNKFIYFGSLITEDNKVFVEIKEGLANRSYFSLSRIGPT
jgi:hypothetical protein